MKINNENIDFSLNYNDKVMEEQTTNNIGLELHEYGGIDWEYEEPTYCMTRNELFELRDLVDVNEYEGGLI